MGNQRRADAGPVTRQQSQQVRSEPGGVEQPHGFDGDQRGLFGWLGQHGIARCQRCCDLPGKDCQRKIPRADTGEDSAPEQLPLVGFPDRTCKSSRRTEFRFRQHSVVAAEIGRFAHFRHGIGKGLACLQRQQRDQRVHRRLQRIAHRAQHCGPRRTAAAIPARLRGAGAGDGRVDMLRPGARRHAEHALGVSGGMDWL